MALASVLTIMAISLERYYAICHPLKVQYTCTLRRILKIIIAIWVIALATCLPFTNMAVYKDSKFIDGTPIKVCRTYVTYPWQKVYLISLIGLFFLVPLVLLLVVYSIISRQLINESIQAKLMSDHSSHSSLKARRQVVVMLFAVITMFFICLLPMEAVRLWTMFSTATAIRRLGLESYLNIIYFARVMLYLNSTINPFCYSITSTKFRNAFKRAIGIKRKGRNSFMSTQKGSSQTQITLSYYENGQPNYIRSSLQTRANVVVKDGLGRHKQKRGTYI